MMQPVLFMILGLSLTSLVRSQCPDIDDEPVMDPYESDLFLCADVYQGPGDYDAIQACNTCEEDGFGQVYHENGHAAAGTEGYYYPIGSLIVMPGCTFYGFSEINYEGDVRQYDGGQVVPMVEYVDDFNMNEWCGETIYGFSSMKCQCVQELIECDPEDDYDNVITCDNRNNIFPVDCHYTQTIGTEYSEASEESRAVSEAVSYEIEVGLMDLFSESLGYSVTTEYDWSQSNSETFSETESSTMTFTVPPGFKTSVDQVVGYCDGNTSLPNEFRFTTESADGKKEVKFYSAGPDGQLVEVHHKKRGDSPKEMKKAPKSKKTE